MKLNIQNKLLLPIIIAVAVIMLCSTLIITRQVSNELEETYWEELGVVNGTLLKLVEGAGSGYKRDLVSLAVTPVLRRHFIAVSEGDKAVADSTREEVNALLEAYKGIYTHFRVMNIAGPDGMVILGTNKEAVGKVNVSHRRYFQSALKGESSISEPLMSMEIKEKAVCVATPVLNWQNKPIAVLYSILPCKDISDATVGGIKIGESGYAFVVDSDGAMLAHNDQKLVLDFKVGDTEWGRRMLQGGDSGQLRYTTTQGIDRLLVYSKDKGTDWYSAVTIAQSEVDKAVDSLRNLSIAITVAGMLAIALIIFLIVRPIIRDLLQGVGFASAVAEGDLNKKLAARRGDELGTLFDALRGMVSSLKENIEAARRESANARVESENARQAMETAEAAGKEAQAKTDAMLVAADKLESAVNIVSSASTQLAAQIEQSERGAARQAERVSETATAMEEMNSTVLEVARNAGTASEFSVTAREKAEAGARVVLQAVQSIQDVQTQSVKLKEDMNMLDENARSITQIMSVISDIADQTNLLALNAAIEAARAGEAGRGFAVVADEVRKLAEKTLASTTDVGNAIKAIQSSASESAKQVDASATSIEEATTYATQSGEALKEIVAIVDNTADQVRAIATASEEQSATSEEINQSISEVNGIASETARAMHEAAQAVGDLAEQAQVLTRLVEELKKA